MNHEKNNGVGRRDFLTKAAVGSIAGAGALMFAGVIQLPLPKAFNEPGSRFKIGYPDGFPLNAYKTIADRNVFILRNEEGFRALSSICTHLGCIVSYEGTGFVCPCHGSKFNEVGNVLSGPAPKALEWLKMGVTPEGKLFVDSDKKVLYHEFFTV